MAQIWRCLRCSRPRMCSSGAWIEPSKWLRLWPQGSSLDTKKNWPCPLWQELFYSPQKPHVKTCPEAVFEHQRSALFYHCKTILWVERQPSEFPSEGRTFPFSFPGNFSIRRWRNREGRNQFLLFCFHASLHTSLEGVVSTQCKSLSIPCSPLPKCKCLPKASPCSWQAPVSCLLSKDN